MGNSDNTFAEAITTDVNRRFDQFEQNAQERLDKSLSNFEDYLRRAAEERMEKAEERLTKDVRTKGIAVIAVAAGALIAGFFGATREVNESVISLQKDIISAETNIQESTKHLDQANKSISDAEGQLTVEKSKLVAAQTEVGTLLEEIKVTDGRSTKTLNELDGAIQKTKQLTAELQTAKADYARLQAKRGEPQPVTGHR